MSLELSTLADPAFYAPLAAVACHEPPLIPAHAPSGWQASAHGLGTAWAPIGQTYAASAIRVIASAGNGRERALPNALFTVDTLAAPPRSPLGNRSSGTTKRREYHHVGRAFAAEHGDRQLRGAQPDCRERREPALQRVQPVPLRLIHRRGGVPAPRPGTAFPPLTYRRGSAITGARDEGNTDMSDVLELQSLATAEVEEPDLEPKTSNLCSILSIYLCT